jgi:hypothetical protein
LGQLNDGLSFAWQPTHIVADELFDVSFDLDEEVTADPGELVGALGRRRKGEVFDVLAAD